MHKYQCTGVKACEFIDNELEGWHHTEVNSSFWTKWQAHYDRLATPNTRRIALRYI